jgi:hypothetical protein
MPDEHTDFALDGPALRPKRDRTGRVKSKTGLRLQRQVLTRAELDGRSHAGKLFNQIVRDIEIDLGGHDQLSTVELQLVEAFAGAAVRLSDLNARALIGQTQRVDLSEYANAVGAMVRVATRLGTRRRAKDVTVPSLRQYLHQREVHEQHDDEAVP